MEDSFYADSDVPAIAAAASELKSKADELELHAADDDAALAGYDLEASIDLNNNLEVNVKGKNTGAGKRSSRKKSGGLSKRSASTSSNLVPVLATASNSNEKGKGKGKKKKKASSSTKKGTESRSASKSHEVMSITRIREDELAIEAIHANVNSNRGSKQQSITDLGDYGDDDTDAESEVVEDYSTLIKRAVAAIMHEREEEWMENEVGHLPPPPHQDLSSACLTEEPSSAEIASPGEVEQSSDSALANSPEAKKPKKVEAAAKPALATTTSTGTKAKGKTTNKKRSTISIFADGRMVVYPSSGLAARTLQLNRLITGKGGSKFTRKPPKKKSPSQITAKSGSKADGSSTSVRSKVVSAKPSNSGAGLVKSSSKSVVPKSSATTTTATPIAGPGTKLKAEKSNSIAGVGVGVNANSAGAAKKKAGKGVGKKEVGPGVGKSQSDAKISGSTAPALAAKTKTPKSTVRTTHAAEEHDTDNTSIYNVTGFKVAPPAPLSKKPNMWDISLYLTRIQNYFHVLGYQRVGEPKIVINTHASIRNLNETAKKLIRAGDPIKCLHALVLSTHLTNCSLLVERFPINFKSKFKGKEYKHVVLGVYMFGRYGALGISRDPGLQSKSVDFLKLGDMLENFRAAYEESGHELLEIRVGGAITHDPHSLGVIQWKLGPILNYRGEPEDLQSDMNRISKLLRSEMSQICLRNSQPDTKSIDPETVTKEYILQHTRVTLRRVGQPSAALIQGARPRPKTPKSDAKVKPVKAVKAVVSLDRVKIKTKLKQPDTDSIPASAPAPKVSKTISAVTSSSTKAKDSTTSTAASTKSTTKKGTKKPFK